MMRDRTLTRHMTLGLTGINRNMSYENDPNAGTVKVYISYSDGEYYASLVEDGCDFDSQNPQTARIPVEKWEEYKRFCEEHREWRTYWKDIDNALFDNESK